MTGLSTCKFPPPFRDTGMRGGGSEEAGDEVLRKSDLNCLRNTLEATVQCLFLFSLTFHPPSVVTGLAGTEWTVALVRGLLHAPGVCVCGMLRKEAFRKQEQFF